MRILFLTPFTALFLQAAGSIPTYYKDVLPILQERCQTCHRSGEIGPMPLMTYKQTRPYAAAIREAVILKKMPPWGADSAYGHFANDPSLSPKQIETISAWASAHAPEGDPKDAPQPVSFTEGWTIPKPDLVLEMPKPYAIPAKGTLEYTYYLVPTHFKEDRWVRMAEIRPGNRAVVHHVIAYLREPGSKWLAEIKPGEPFVPVKTANPDTGRLRRDDTGRGEFLVGYAPGVPAVQYKPNQAKLIKAGSDIIFEVHYTANGKDEEDLTKVGLIFAKEPPQERVITFAAINGKFKIPPGAADHPVEATATFYGDAKIISLAPHMHLRGKSFRYEMAMAGGERQTLLNVPRYDFHWQTWYAPAEPIPVHAGTKIDCFATFDNSANNPYNPDPKLEVSWGDQSWEEMMAGFVEVAFDATKSPADILAKPKEPAPSRRSIE